MREENKKNSSRNPSEEFNPQNVAIIIITGLSGSGKSSAIKAFEDLSYFCIDNLPLPLLPDFLKLQRSDMKDIDKIALGVDIRERRFFREYPEVFEHLNSLGYDLEIIFLEANDKTLQRRFSQTRRKHPLAFSEMNLLEAIGQERKELEGLRQIASRVIDTTETSVHRLKSIITTHYSHVDSSLLLLIELISFGFKFGVPFEADIIMDVRFLPNPFFIEELRGLTGNDEEIKKWVMKWPLAKDFLQDFSGLVIKYLPRYIEEGKRYLNIAVGCTGGRHRSVVMVEELKKVLQDEGYEIVTYHRDIDMD